MDMDPSSAQHLHQDMSSQTLERMFACTKPQQEKKPKPADEVQKCPRCDSANTKFCYYNNYSLTQPRYFCKSCKRYWTKGGTLRNVPVGGGCRKNKRSSSSKRSQDQSLTTSPNQISSLTQLSYDSNNLRLARLQNQESGQLGLENHDISMMYRELQRTIQTEAIFSDTLHLANSENSVSCDVLKNRGMCTSSAEAVVSAGFLDALRGGILETPINGFNHDLYYINGNIGHVENGDMGVNSSEEMVTRFDQEMRNGAI